VHYIYSLFYSFPNRNVQNAFYIPVARVFRTLGGRIRLLRPNRPATAGNNRKRLSRATIESPAAGDRSCRVRSYIFDLVRSRDERVRFRPRAPAVTTNKRGVGGRVGCRDNGVRVFTRAAFVLHNAVNVYVRHLLPLYTERNTIAFAKRLTTNVEPKYCKCVFGFLRNNYGCA